MIATSPVSYTHLDVYKRQLYSYAIKVDSAKYFYELLRKSGIFPHNNYATFRSICGDFREAEKEYEEAISQDSRDKRLKEWAYYTSIIDIYKGQPKEGISLMRDMIKANGSTPVSYTHLDVYKRQY